MISMARRLVFATVALAACGAAPAAVPEAGRHTAQLCVATQAGKPPSCGPAQVDVRGDGTMRVRVDDVVYSLQLRSSQVDVVVMHNVVRIDEFTASYEWAGSALTFNDSERQSRYEVRFEPRKR